MNEPTPDSSSQLLADLQSLKQHPGYQYIMDIVAGWEVQANEDVMLKRNPGKEEEDRGEWKAYRRVRKLTDQRISDLLAPPPSEGMSDFDPYNK